MSRSSPYIFSRGGMLLFALLIATCTALNAAAPPLTIPSAVYNKKSGTLKVTTKAKGQSGELMLLHDRGGILGTRPSGGNKQTFIIPRTQLAEVPCQVEARIGKLSASKKVAGASVDCKTVPVCQVQASKTAANVGEKVSFTGQVKQKGKRAGTPKYEWDFAGGAMGHPSGNQAEATFIRDDSVYRVRFTATDAQGRRCEAAIEVTVGTPPSGLPAKVAEQPAPVRGGEMAGTADDLVVLPFEQWTMQHRSEMNLNPNGYVPFDPLINNLNAYVYKKALQPQPVPADTVDVRYSAASNPFDPVGGGSINSTSRNFPLTAASMQAATLRKSDLWDSYVRPGNLPADYRSLSWVAMAPWSWDWWAKAPATAPEPDEGYFQDHVPDFDVLANQAGSQMPGKSAPYQSNEPKSFRSAPAGESYVSAAMIPVTDIDDQGRVNPYPLMRVEAVQNGIVKASTDAVLSNSRDFHCRECHIKGGVAANPNAPYTKDAYLYSAWAQRFTPPDPNTAPQKPTFFDAASSSIEDQEYAAALNFTSLHDFYDNMGLNSYMLGGMTMEGMNGDSPQVCYICHGTALDFIPFDRKWWKWEQRDTSLPNYDPDYSVAMHKFHGQLQWKDEAHSDIKRDSRGVFERWTGPGLNPNSLFPIFDKNGQKLPQDENCLKCHSGHREQLYRDRMFTAGVSCYDCHGDMLAMGETFKKPKSGTDGHEYREPWFDEPDCGACHIGDGNKGKGGSAEFFSAGVMRTAFAATDLSATPREIDLNDPQASRFAVVPVVHKEFPMSVSGWDSNATGPDGKAGDYVQLPNEKLVLDAKIFREGKDKHGNVACAACHGAAHAIWPNRDPKSNDNVTAQQLQGHTGTILECNVCHSAESFKELKNLDGGRFMTDLPVDSGVLGGPHNMHPVNDPFWWKEAPADSQNTSDGTTKGGWHNNYAKKPGKSGEDQCAACHGADHKGTRLSKTPVERTFVNPKAKGVKARVTVKAGKEISCDLCHSLAKSFTKP